jgi:hypothetical protein
VALLLKNLCGIPMIPIVLIDVYKFQKMLMKKNTRDSYLKEIKAKYEQEKTGEYASLLAKPTPASLKNLCNIIDDSNISLADKEILNKFYTVKKFDIDKFRPICNFYKGITVEPHPSVVDVLALLVNFQPRPLGKYLKSEANSNENELQKINVSKVISEVEIEKKEELQSEVENKTAYLEKKKISKKAVVGVVVFMAILTILFFSFQRKNCMQWSNDHYEEVSCDEVTNQSIGLLGNYSKIKKADQNLMEGFKKIKVCDTTRYFNPDGTPRVWYCKSELGIECFTMPGLHPETEQTLKKITPYIIDKYLK